MNKERYMEDRETLEMLARLGTAGTEKVVQMADTLTDRLVSAQTVARRSSREASYGFKARQTVGGNDYTNHNLVGYNDLQRSARGYDRDANDPFWLGETKPREPRQATRKNKATRLIVGTALALSLVGGSIGFNVIQDENYHEATKVVETINAGDWNPSLEGFPLEVQANGDCFFRDQNGNGCKIANGINADDFAKGASEYLQSQTGPTLT